LLLTPEETATPRELQALEETLAERELLSSHTVIATGTGPVVVGTALVGPRVPPRSILPMEMATISYLRPRDALTRLHRLLSATGNSL
jgi:hypothetical protein